MRVRLVITVPSHEEMAHNAAVKLCELDHGICECNKRTDKVLCETYKRKGSALAYWFRKFYVFPTAVLASLVLLDADDADCPATVDRADVVVMCLLD